jgi:hypothetical protein
MNSRLLHNRTSFFKNEISAFDAVRLALAFYFSDRSFVRSVSFLQVVSQANVECDGHAQNHERAYTQYQKPPDHPHSRLG